MNYPAFGLPRNDTSTSRAPLAWWQLAAVALALNVGAVSAEDALECSSEDVPEGYIEAARADAVLATLSLAAYLDCPPDLIRADAEYRLDGWFPEGEKRDYGLAYVVYGKYPTSGPDRRVQKIVAYRGTEFSSPADWVLGNLPLLRFQYRLAEKKLDDVLKDRQPDEEIIYTGHSLGGGLAVSMWRYRAENDNGIRAVSFNGSPMFGCILGHNGSHTCKREVQGDAPLWHNAYEKGDPTRIVGNLFFPWRWNWLVKHWRFDRNPYYHQYDFLEPVAIADHSMATLANNLACKTKDTNADLVQAIAGIQCVRDHEGDRSSCPPDIKEASGALRFDNNCTDRKTRR